MMFKSIIKYSIFAVLALCLGGCQMNDGSPDYNRDYYNISGYYGDDYNRYPDAYYGNYYYSGYVSGYNNPNYSGRCHFNHYGGMTCDLY